MNKVGTWSLCALSFALWLPVVGQAAGIPWHRTRFEYVTQGSRVDDTLNLFAAVEQVPIHIVAAPEENDVSRERAGHAPDETADVDGDESANSNDRADAASDLDGAMAATEFDGFNGTVRGRFAMPPTRFLDVVCASHGLVWYYDGAMLQISLASDERRVAIQTPYLHAEALRDALQRVGVLDARFPVHVDRRTDTVMVKGPVTYLDRVLTAARQFEDQARDDTPTTARVIRLTHATAADQRTDINGHLVIVPGVAAELARRFNPVQVHVYGTPQRVIFGARLPIIEADAATNSVLIRDKPERIDGDAMLVSDMDVKARAVMVQTWVVDVDATALSSLTSLDALTPLTPASAVSAAAPLMLPQQQAAIRPTVLFGTMTQGAGALMMQLAGLEKAGRAQAVVTHDAVTMDRTPAVIDRREAVLEHKIAGGDTSLDALAAAKASTGDFWLSVRPTIGGAGTQPPVALEIDAGGGRQAEASVAPGQGMVMTLSSPDSRLNSVKAAAPTRQRLVILVPRVLG